MKWLVFTLALAAAKPSREDKAHMMPASAQWVDFVLPELETFIGMVGGSRAAATTRAAHASSPPVRLPRSHRR